MDSILDLAIALLIIGIATVFHRLLGGAQETRSAGTPTTLLLNGLTVGAFIIMMGAAMVEAEKVFYAAALLFFALAGVYVAIRISRRK
jgi:hypothetical protein